MKADYLDADPEQWMTDPVKRVLKHKRYTLGKKLAAGAYGQVYKGTKVFKDTGESIPIAVKVMVISKLSVRYQKVFLIREITALKEFVHPNAIKIWDIIKMDDKIWIFMEVSGSIDKLDGIRI